MMIFVSFTDNSSTSYEYKAMSDSVPNLLLYGDNILVPSPEAPESKVVVLSF